MCDSKLKLSVLAADGIVENAITELMGDLGIDGIVAMEKYSAMWLMVKNHICFVRRPGWREEFTVRCFISGYTAVKLYVDTIIESKEGEILVKGRKISGPGTDRIMVFQDFNQLFPWKTVEKNIQYPLKIRGIKDKAELKRLSDEALERFV